MPSLNSRLYDFKDAMHAGELEDLLYLGLRMQQPKYAVAAASGFVKGDERAQTATVNESRLGKVHIDIGLAITQAGADPVPESIGVGGTQFLDFGNNESTALGLHLHRPDYLIAQNVTSSIRGGAVSASGRQQSNCFGESPKLMNRPMFAP
jgi:hypothetical protein